MQEKRPTGSEAAATTSWVRSISPRETLRGRGRRGVWAGAQPAFSAVRLPLVGSGIVWRSVGQSWKYIMTEAGVS